MYCIVSKYGNFSKFLRSLNRYLYKHTYGSNVAYENVLTALKILRKYSKTKVQYYSYDFECTLGHETMIYNIVLCVIFKLSCNTENTAYGWYTVSRVCIFYIKHILYNILSRAKVPLTHILYTTYNISNIIQYNIFIMFYKTL
mgnify:CR=1 FL=1